VNHSPIIRFGFSSLAGLVALLPVSASACASCFGQSDSPMAKGMNAGIFALLLVITSVLLGVAIFFAYILRRAARLSEAAAAPEAEPIAPLAGSTQPVVQPNH
jgi:heme/copper-type cytochrome/quinol oxidase subunit 2